MSFNTYLDKTQEIGFVQATETPLVYVKGLPKAKPEELIIFESGQFGQVLSLEEDVVEVLVFSNEAINLNTRAVRTDSVLEMPVGREVLGQVITPLGKSFYKTRKLSEFKESLPVSYKAPGISERRQISEPFLTGVSIIDLMVPLGRGQRELILGDRKTGKTSFAQQVLLNQAKMDTICIYACIGKKRSDIKHIEEYMQTHQIMQNCIIVATSASDPLGEIYITPYAAMSVAEYFRNEGKDVMIIFDDMTRHANYYREISLLAKKFPGRASYPGDIFYTHSRLLERAGNFKKGSITALPIVNTIEGDISGYIQTNLMSMTDGHIFFDFDLFGAGQRPAINYFLSVTRVGRQTQSPLRWSVNRELNSFFTLYQRTQNFVHFGAELSAGIKSTLDLGDKILLFFNQRPSLVLDIKLQLIFMCILWSGLWNNKDLNSLEDSITKVIKNYENKEEFRQSMISLIDTSTDLNNLLGNFMKNLKKHEAFI